MLRREDGASVCGKRRERRVSVEVRERGADGTVWLCPYSRRLGVITERCQRMEMNPPEFIDVPAGTYIYGHRSLMPRRFERTEETKTKEIEAAMATRFSQRVERHRFSKEVWRKSLDGEISGRPWMKANRELDSAGSSRKNSIDQQHKPGPNLSAAAKPFDISKLDSLPRARHAGTERGRPRGRHGGRTSSQKQWPSRRHKRR